MSGARRRPGRAGRLLPPLVLVALWTLLPDLLLFDALATAHARLAGVVAGAAAALLTAALAAVRARRGVLTSFALALDLGLAVTICAVGRWLWSARHPDLPYFESFSLFALQLATGWGVALWSHVAARGAITPGGPLPGVRLVYTVAAATVGLLAAVVLGVGVSARAAGHLDRGRAERLGELADVVATGVAAAPGAARRLVRLAAQEAGTDAALLPDDQRPAVLAEADAVAPGPDGWLTRRGAARWHVRARPTAAGTIWLWQAANVRPPVRAPDDAPAMLILAFLVLGAPLAAFMVADDLRVQLTDIAAALRAMGAAAASAEPAAAEAGPPGVPIDAEDEVGDLAKALNASCARLVHENRTLAADLDAAALSDQARTRFLAAANHELRTPLNSINGYCHLLSVGDLSAGQRESVEVIAQGARQLLGHVDDILDLSRIEAGREEQLRPAPVDLAEIARSVLRARGDAAAPGVTTGLEAAADAPPVLADADRIRQVVENLVGNALKFTAAGSVRIEVRPVRLPGGDAGVRLTVRDTGRGIPEEDLETIFEEFHRVQRHRDVAGTGLGLAIARRLVGRQGGRLWVESALGEGSAFHLEMPAARPT
ncbi:MAG: HAMP domain-containing histidine kinase [Myxococcales bacterium]|nr:HAMP domain-containing histidine kinase [Myxococcales bacterium]